MLLAIVAGIVVGVAAGATVVVVTQDDSSEARFADTARTVRTNIPLSDYSSHRELTVGSHTAFITDGDGAVRAIDLASGEVSFIKVGSVSSGAAIDPGTGTLYVAANDGGVDKSKVSVISASTKSIQANVAVTSAAEVVAVDSESHTVYVAGVVGPTWDDKTSALSIIDAKTNALTAEIPIEGRVSDMVADPKTHLVYAAIYRGSSTVLTIIDPAAKSATATIPLGTYASGLAFSSKTNTLYATVNEKELLDPAVLYVIDPQGKTVTSKVPLTQTAPDLGVDPSTGDIFIIGGDDKDHAGYLKVYGAAPGDAKGKVTVTPEMKTVGFADTTLDQTTGNVYVLDNSGTLFAIER
ncbi:hypothetical protein AB0N05_21915 [Nocardia sp. NPDC051030]|uniref:hypothetical protein n=1 Tax=Nocardia sp. NPDC051030 TaxID=3155162 RepID=UPI003425F7B6